MIITQGYITGNMCTHGFGGTPDKIYSDCIFMNMEFGALDMAFSFSNLDSTCTETQYLNSAAELSTIEITMTFKKLGMSANFKCEE